MPIETPIDLLMRQLSEAGLRPKEHLVKQVVAQGEAAVPALTQLAIAFGDLHEEEPLCYGPIHALRLLGEIGSPAAVAPLLSALPVPVYEPDEESGYVDVPGTLWGSEVLQIVAHCGAEIEPFLWAWADDEQNSPVSQGAALQGLAYVAVLRDGRTAIIDEARRRLAQGGPPTVMAGLINLLADLGDKASYSAIMAAYRAGQVDQSRMAAASARQLLLSGGRRDLTCVNHSLWERYEQHGPGPGEGQR
jgi:hypothetical protein